MAKIKNEHYITIQEFMVRDLELSGNELIAYALIAYALIYGFSQNRESKFEGSLSYVAKWLNCSKTTAFNILNKLADDGFIRKIENVKNGIKFCDYKANTMDEETLKKIKENKTQRKQKEKNERRSKKLNGIQKNNVDRSKNLNEGVQKTLTHNTIDILEHNTNNTLSGERAVSESEQLESKKPEQKKQNRKSEANTLFEQLWSLYPLKKGKGSVSDTQKAKLLEIGYEELERAISRYVKYVDSVDYLHYKNGSTFFNSGYIDYLDANYEECGNKKLITRHNGNTTKSNTETDYKTRLEKAKKKAAEEFGEEFGQEYWEGMSDLEIESHLALMGIDV